MKFTAGVISALTVIMLSPIEAWGDDNTSPSHPEKNEIRNGPTDSNSERYHKASTTSEIALDKIIRMTETEAGLFDFLVKRPGRNKQQDSYFGKYFSAQIQQAWAREETKEVKKNCNGVYVEGELCGLDVNPLTCAQDNNDGNYIYRTDQEDTNLALISYRWPQLDGIIATYRMNFVHGRWIIDGVSCNPEPSFNMPNTNKK